MGGTQRIGDTHTSLYYMFMLIVVLFWSSGEFPNGPCGLRFYTPDTQYTPARARPLHLFWSPDVFLHVALQLHVFGHANRHAYWLV